MNPEAVEWLENLDEGVHAYLFAPNLFSPDSVFASFKDDHEGASTCWHCLNAIRSEGLLVIG